MTTSRPPRTDGGSNGTADPGGSPPRWEGSPEAVARAQLQGAILRDLSAATYLASSVGNEFGKSVDSTGCKQYRDRLLREAGSPTDPIEVMLIEQAALAHHNLGRLYVRASKVQNLEAVKLYHDALCRLLGEFRRLALALRAYRAPLASPQVGRHDVAEDNSQVESDATTPNQVNGHRHAEPNGRKKGSTTKLASNRVRKYMNGHTKPPPRRGRASEQAPASAAVS